MESAFGTKMPLVSVIIPAYNASVYIKDAIESVLTQTYKNIEIIVIDDGSTDNTKEEISLYRHKLHYCYQKNAGVSAARNAGILLARGEYITCLDADDIMNEDKISFQIDFLINNPRAKIVFTDYINFEDSCKNTLTHFQTCHKLKKQLYKSGNNYLLESQDALNILVEENISLGSNPLFNKTALNQIGLYDCCLSQGEDFEFHYRFAKHFDIGIIDKVLLYRRLHENNASKNLTKLLYKAGMSRIKILIYEDNKLLKNKIKYWLRNVYLDVAYTLSAYDCMLSLTMSIFSIKYGFSTRTIKIICRSLIMAIYSKKHEAQYGY